MNRGKLRILIIGFLVLFMLGITLNGQEARWFKGQTHAHTNNSDGDELPRRVVRWYRDHNFNFLVITDHNYLTEIKYLDTDKNDDFILIPGIEVTDSFDKKPLHVNGIYVKQDVEPQHGKGVVQNLQQNIDAVLKAGGIAQVNHPNWRWAFDHNQLAALKNVKLFELYNMDKFSNNFAAGGYPGMEEIWDQVLSKGVVMYGVATDDAHDYEGEIRPERSYPGRGWVMVRAKELTPEAITAAMEKGDFYSTVGMGVTLEDIAVTESEYRLKIRPHGHLKFTTSFIGKGGKILKEDYSLNPVYKFKGNELYVRARVFCSSGDFAVTQPFFIKQ